MAIPTVKIGDNDVPLHASWDVTPASHQQWGPLDPIEVDGKTIHRVYFLNLIDPITDMDYDEDGLEPHGDRIGQTWDRIYAPVFRQHGKTGDIIFSTDDGLRPFRRGITKSGGITVPWRSELTLTLVNRDFFYGASVVAREDWMDVIQNDVHDVFKILEETAEGKRSREAVRMSIRRLLDERQSESDENDAETSSPD
jgi:hypothetical protein